MYFLLSVLFILAVSTKDFLFFVYSAIFPVLSSYQLLFGVLYYILETRSNAS